MVMCFGDTEFPIITINARTKLGIKTSLNLHKEIPARAMKHDSRIMAFTINFGSPIGIPIIPIKQTAARAPKTIL